MRKTFLDIPDVPPDLAGRMWIAGLPVVFDASLHGREGSELGFAQSAKIPTHNREHVYFKGAVC